MVSNTNKRKDIIFKHPNVSFLPSDPHYEQWDEGYELLPVLIRQMPSHAQIHSPRETTDHLQKVEKKSK